jgi:4-hydroxybenzoate polyprenyltransferase
MEWQPMKELMKSIRVVYGSFTGLALSMMASCFLLIFLIVGWLAYDFVMLFRTQR